MLEISFARVSCCAFGTSDKCIDLQGVCLKSDKSKWPCCLFLHCLCVYVCVCVAGFAVPGIA